MSYPVKNTDTPSYASKNSNSFSIDSLDSMNITWAKDLNTWAAETRTWAATFNAVWSYITKN